MDDSGKPVRICAAFVAFCRMILDVVLFWKVRLLSWLTSDAKKKLRQVLASAQVYEEWEETALELDKLLNSDAWRDNYASRHYDYRLIKGRLEALRTAKRNNDILNLVNLLRSGLVRNLGNITSPKLFVHAYIGTKLLITEYVTEVAHAIQHVTALETTPIHESGFTSQAKLELLHDTRQAFGRTTLILQGGSVFGMCHLGVVKALHLQGLLPRIITGTGTGALIAALVGIHTEDELLTFLHGDGIDLTAFDRRRRREVSEGRSQWLWRQTQDGRLWTLLRRIKRFVQKGHFFDSGVLEECVRANLGDLTFEEAYARSKHILNITIATSSKTGAPNLLNYLTAPNVLIWSAAVASNVSSSSLYQPVTIYCKDETGSIVPWPYSQDVTFQPWRHVQYNEGESPLSRIAELFNVNHFIISQARPYLVPFLSSESELLDQRPVGRWNFTRTPMRLVVAEFRHRLKQLSFLGLLPQWIGRLLIEETIPGPSLTLVPDLSWGDFTKLFENPTKESLDHWILKGEKGLWPAVSALWVRCVVEVELDKGYQVVRRRRPSETYPAAGPRRMPNEGLPRRRRGYSIDYGRDPVAALGAMEYQEDDSNPL
ncbi:hypothetical protein P170DRAFT_514325 [Aspergillus steynii IBT 23096]|uniref:PNPLA domain-containing protein n=1 Tax=Aspergillus steynii IBT 23096 TaxID=1392250 RepID=A0A2I2FTW3_9EURO|nr:uncharacterized protein P170DRAFT_514325 [Aspergillus steynii IBT 23096]PLB44041.1 hypothetical protein P170DRAFT_514325 [Aspergillus steynii IBT 23096]